MSPDKSIEQISVANTVFGRNNKFSKGKLGIIDIRSDGHIPVHPCRLGNVVLVVVNFALLGRRAFHSFILEFLTEENIKPKKWNIWSKSNWIILTDGIDISHISGSGVYGAAKGPNQAKYENRFQFVDEFLHLFWSLLFSAIVHFVIVREKSIY